MQAPPANECCPAGGTLGGRGGKQIRPGKSPRPIVVAPIKDRIVRRSILNVLQSRQPIEGRLLTPQSYGGVPGRGIREAMQAIASAVKGGARAFVRSDIRDFFPRLRRDLVLSQIKAALQDEDFFDLLDAAVRTELDNQKALGEFLHLFPLGDLGMAQGSCLSPLFANYLLSDFDATLTGRGVTVIRYIDDFVLLASSERSVAAAFASAKRLLEDLGLSAYEPTKFGEKSAVGRIEDGFDFLGCEVKLARSGELRVLPSRGARVRFLGELDDVFSEAERKLSDNKKGKSEVPVLLPVLKHTQALLQGWGNAYSFCTERRVFGALDGDVDRRLAKFARHIAVELLSLDDHAARERRRLLGLSLLSESKCAPVA